MERKNIVVLGAGFGGLRAAMDLAKSLERHKLLDRYSLTLVDRHDHHTYTPLLYEAATTSKETANLPRLHKLVAFNIPTLLGKLPVAFIKDEVTTLDLMEGDVHLRDNGKLPCEYLVLALGAEVNFFGIPGAAENTLPLKTFENAIAIRDRIVSLAQEKKTVNVMVGGGGPTGVELAGELREWGGELRRTIKDCDLKVTIVEALPSILFGFDARVLKKVTRRLTKLGVDIMTNGKIVGIDKDSLALDGGKKIPFDVMIWSGGVKASPLLGQLPLNLEKGRPVIGGVALCVPQTPDLKLRTRVYGIGDNVCYMNPKTNKAMPTVAPVAIVEGSIAAHNIIQEILATERSGYEPHPNTYLPVDYPYVIPVGGKFAVAKIGPVVLSSVWGWFFKGLVELDYILSIMPFWRGLGTWLGGLRIFIQNDRLG